MEVSKVASWGTKEDRPERDEMRSRLIGHDFMAEYRVAEGGKKEHEDSGWFDLVREKTVPELRWMWSNPRAFNPEHGEAYAQVAGDLLLKEIAQGRLSLRPMVQAGHQRSLRLAVRTGVPAA